MYKTKHHIFLFLSIILLGSCEKTIPIDLEEKNKYVANTVANSDSVMTVQVLKSKSILSDKYGYDTVKNAQVTISNNGIVYPLTLQNGTYTGSSYFESGEIYELNVQIGDTILRAETKIPMKIPALQFDTSREYHDGIPYRILHITFNDIADIDYYKLRVLRGYEYTYYDWYSDSNYTYISTDLVWFTIDNKLIDIININPYSDLDNIEGEQYISEMYFSDKNYENGTFSFSIDLGPLQSYYDPYSESIENFTVELSSISQEYLFYKRSVELQSYTSGDPFAQPVIVYTNIENGLGVFAGVSTNLFTFE